MGTLLLLLLVSAIRGISAGLAQDFNGYKVYRLFPANLDHIRVIKGLKEDNPELDFWTDATHPGNPVDVNVPPQTQYPFLASIGKNLIKHEVRIRDVGNLVKKEKSTTKKHSFANEYYEYDKYHRYGEMLRELRLLTQWYPEYASLSVIGTTYEGRKIYSMTIEKDKQKKRKIVFIDCGIHAREWISPATCMYIISQLLEGLYFEPNIQDVMDKYAFVIVPVFNVDGYEYTHTSNRLWRKTRRPYGSCFGADPNRNWDYEWSAGVGTSDDPCSDTYRGPNAFSEIEVKSIAKYLTSIKERLISYYNIHAYSQMWLTPWSYTETIPKDWTEIKRVAEIGTKAINQPYGTNYTYGQPSRILYGVSGGSIDWTYAALGVKYSYALELRDTGEYGFILPADQIYPTGQETLAAILAAVKAMKV